MIVVNFGHPLTAEQVTQVEALAGAAVERVIEAPTHFDDGQPFGPQVVALVEQVGLTATEWQALPLLVNPPAYGPIVAVLLAHLHGLCGHFPTLLRLRPVSASTPVRFEVAEVVALDRLRANARAKR